tara:strand:- start:1813 stop:1962 length:150 start_codon:yes stop_codon:yes gene_type:complete
MAKMTKAQARKRLKEANSKVMSVLMCEHITADSAVKLNAMLTKCIKRLE